MPPVQLWRRTRRITRHPARQDGRLFTFPPGSLPGASDRDTYAATEPDREARALLSRIIGIIVAVLVIVWIISNPASAGDTVHGWITGLITFFHHLA